MKNAPPMTAVLYYPLIGVVADGTASKAFFLKDQLFVESAAVGILCGASEVEIWIMAVVVVDNLVV